MITPTAQACPCESGRSYAACCGPCHDDTQPATTAEVLMRSRYAAFVLIKPAYLLVTWHPSTRPAEFDLSSPPTPKWLGLRVVRHTVIDAGHAEVEFIARYKVGGRAYRLHERSRFVRENSRWYYLDGDQIA